MERPAALGVLVAALLASCSPSPPKARPTPSPTATVAVKTFPVKGHPNAILADASSLWVTDDQGNSVARLDATTAKQIWRLKICKAAVAMARARGVLWIACSLDDEVLRVDEATGTLLGKVKTGGDPVDVTYGFGSLWTANLKDKTVTRIDEKTARATATIKIAQGVVRLSAGHGAVWVTGETNTVNRIDPKRNTLTGTPITVGNGPLGIDATGAYVWVSAGSPGSVLGIDPAFQDPQGPFKTGGNTGEITQAGTAVWVTDAQGQTLHSVDIASGRLTQLPVGATPARITWSGSYVWVAGDDPNEIVRVG